MKLYFTTLLICVATVLAAIPPEQVHESPGSFRIKELMPQDLVKPLGVEPAIPADWVAMSPDGELDSCNWTYWGPKNALEALFETPDKPSATMIRVKLSANVAQSQVGRFGKEMERAIADSKRLDPRLQATQHQWGDNPVFAINMKLEGHPVQMAWVGLNDCSGATLMFHLVYVDQQKGPTAQELALWDNFLRNTQGLTDQQFFKAMGLDMQPGYTIVSTAGAKIAMTAEMRESDGKIQVVVAPMQPGDSYELEELLKCHLGSKWKHGELLVKAYGTITSRHGNSTNVVEHVSSILVETVKEFSVGPDEAAAKGYIIQQI